MNFDNITKTAKDEDEIIFIKRMIDIFERVQEKRYTVLTNYLDPGQQYLLEYVHGYYNVNTKIFPWGGYDKSERKRVAIMPEFYEGQPNMEIEVLNIQSNKFTKEISHRDILGSVLGRGVTREHVGDILVTVENNAYVFVTKGISNYLFENINKVGREHIQVAMIDIIDVHKLNVKSDLCLSTIISTSLRIDNIIASAFKLSRTVASEIVEKGLVKVNFRLENKGHKELDNGDLLSVRGYGRCKIISIKGETKKGRQVIDVEM